MADEIVDADEPRQPIQVDLVKDRINEDDVSALGQWASKILEPAGKEMTAKWIARWIVVLSAVSIMTILLLGFSLIFLLRHDPEVAKQLIVTAVIPLLEKSATFFTTVFSPLLAFILGYYFGQRQAQRRAGDL